MKNILTILLCEFIFLIPVKLFSQTAPNLNTAASYILFTGTGQFTSNSTSTIVIGNVGNQTGPVSAFPPGFLAGQKHFGDAAATQTNLDVTAAYADLAGRTCGTAHGVGFGAGETLIPGTYCSIAASTLNGNLTLDAGGNPAAVFIIKIDGAFSAASGSQIILVNQAIACNVFWQVNGAVALSNSTFKGTLLVNGAITLNTGTNLDGRALSKTGALIFGNIRATTCDASTLPLRLVNFDVIKTTGDNVQISWITASEVNVARYEVEASINASVFYKVGTVFSKANSFPSQYSYQDVDINKTGVRFYRLKMIDKDGLFTYSMVKSVKFSELRIGLLTIFPNPGVNEINLSVNAEAQENITLTITNMQGAKVLQKNFKVVAGINNFTQNIQSLSKGSYVISIKNLNTLTQTRQNFQKL